MIIHIAGIEIQIGSQLRQCCGWCGSILIDEDLERTMVTVDDESRRVPTWATGALVAEQGYAQWEVEHEDGANLPAEACGMIEVTAFHDLP